MKAYDLTQSLIGDLDANAVGPILEPILNAFLLSWVRSAIEEGKLSAGLSEGVLRVWLHTVDVEPSSKNLEDALGLNMFAAQDRAEAREIASALRALADKFDAV